MDRKKTTEEFIEEAIRIHGAKYDYSKVNYKNNSTKVCIICPLHGEFWQTPKRHLKGDGCPVCGRKSAGAKNRLNREEFIKRAQEIHGNKYDYSMVEYTTCETPVCIICPIHGKFLQTPTRHLNSMGCPKCTAEHKGVDRRLNQEEFINRLNSIFGNQYDYTSVKYKNTRTPVTVVCKKHGEFSLNASALLAGCGCPKCKKERIEENRRLRQKNTEIEREQKKSAQERVKKEKLNSFIQKAREVHGDKYDYSKVEYINTKEKVCIICPEHGEFWQVAESHLQGAGCPKCASKKLSAIFSFDTDKFMKNAKAIHGDKYDYSKVNYVNNHSKVIIGCPKHGDFLQTPSMHVNMRQGCPLCGTLSSKDELEIYELLKQHYGGIIIMREHSIIAPKELDIFLPDKKIAIEYNGLRWHSSLFTQDKNSHLQKLELCKEKGISLIQVFEDEWVYHKDICKEKILRAIGCSNGNKKISARKCTIKEISYNTAGTFLEANHIQGKSRASVYLGCFFNKELIGVMTFIKENNEKNKWELNRFATKISYVCRGVGGKLFKYFTENYNPQEIKSFADRRWTMKEDNNLYTKLGFSLEGIVPPDYRYVTDKNSFRIRYHKFNFRKTILNKKYGLPQSMTEREMAEKLHYYRIYDCGLFRYLWKPKEKNLAE